MWLFPRFARGRSRFVSLRERKGESLAQRGIIDFLDVLAFSPCAFASNGKIRGGRVVKRKGLSFILWTWITLCYLCVLPLRIMCSIRILDGSSELWMQGGNIIICMRSSISDCRERKDGLSIYRSAKHVSFICARFFVAFVFMQETGNYW